MKYYFDVFRKYADFTGRARRAEYWYFLLFNFIITVAFVFLDGLLGVFSEKYGIGILSATYALIIFVPSMAAATRRLHDINKSGWWQLLHFIPLLGTIILVIYLVQDSRSFENKYGMHGKMEDSHW